MNPCLCLAVALNNGHRRVHGSADAPERGLYASWACGGPLQQTSAVLDLAAGVSQRALINRGQVQREIGNGWRSTGLLGLACHGGQSPQSGALRS